MQVNRFSIRADRRRKALTSFTLVELLTVIMILGLLITIIMPSLQSARIIARVTTTKALFHTMSSALEMFHEDSVIGGRYPPSHWDTTTDGDPYGTGTSTYVAQGAETLVWGLVGADFLGTPGFEINVNDGVLLNQEDDAGLYDLDNDGVPLKHRGGPFFDISKAEIEEYTYRTVTGEVHNPTAIMDSFHRPVLYFLANTSPATVRTDPEHIYDPNDNGLLLEDHNSGLQDDANFQLFVQNPRITVAYRPHNSDSFILISAGPDEQYGTEDDVTNYPLSREDNFPQ